MLCRNQSACDGCMSVGFSIGSVKGATRLQLSVERVGVCRLLVRCLHLFQPYSCTPKFAGLVLVCYKEE